jgi:hypothetical protein
MKSVLSPASLVAIFLIVDGGAYAASGQFDGTWNTTLSCSNADGALGYSFRFPSVVKDDVLHGEKGKKNEPGWLSIDGNVGPDGKAALYVDGLVGAAPYAVGQRPGGTQYGYHVNAVFSEREGRGSRVEGRSCTVEFTKR